MRNPVDREFSKYRFHFQLSSRKKFKAKNQNAESFHRYVVQRLNGTDNAWLTSRYHRYVETALSLFERKNLLFLHFEQFVEDPMRCLEEQVLPFLELDPYLTSTKKRILKELNKGEHANTSKMSYGMLYKTRLLLMKYFSPYNRKLADLLGDDVWTWGY